MAIDLAKLALQGRAFSAVRAWEVEELEALLLIERERNVARPEAANYVRNGILTLEAFDKATKAQFKPKTLDEAAEEVESALKDNEFAGDASKKKGKKK
jgi:hypothetical protein